jgi:hypothetical protein
MEKTLSLIFIIMFISQVGWFVKISFYIEDEKPKPPLFIQILFSFFQPCFWWLGLAPLIICGFLMRFIFWFLDIEL